jgi:hypothetical protein
MSQLYKVSFRSQRGTLTETGVYLVCASSAPDADSMVAGVLGIPSSTCHFDTTRVKPSLYELSRNEYTGLSRSVSGAARAGDRDRAAETVVGGIPLPRTPEPTAAPPAMAHQITIAALVVARSQSVALRRLAEATITRASAARAALPDQVTDFAVTMTATPVAAPRRRRTEEEGLYKHNRFFQGGATRPK